MSAPTATTLPLSSTGHLSLLHPPDSHGFVVVAHGNPWRQHSHEPAELRHLRVKDTPQTYVSMNRLDGTTKRNGTACREAENVTHLNALYVDVDAHETDDTPTHTEIDALLHGCLERVDALGLPQVSYYTRSGRGVHLVWLLETVRKTPRHEQVWRQTARTLALLFGDYGADVSVSTDMTRVLRVSDTMNTKAGRRAKARLVTGERYALDVIGRGVAALNPLTAVYGRERACESVSAARFGTDETRDDAPCSFRWRRAHAARLQELSWLMTLRGWDASGQIPAGKRDAFLFVYAVESRQYLGTASATTRTQELARDMTPWSESEIHTRLSYVFSRPIPYRMKQETVYAFVDVTDAERKTLQELHREKRKALRNARERDDRKNAGSLSADEVKQRAEQQQRDVVALHQQGATNRQVAALMDVSVRQVQRYLQAWRKNNSPLDPKDLTIIETYACHPPCAPDGNERSRAVVHAPDTSLDESPWLPAPP